LPDATKGPGSSLHPRPAVTNPLAQLPWRNSLQVAQLGCVPNFVLAIDC